MPTAARFSITIDGYEIASFSELQGITTEIKGFFPEEFFCTEVPFIWLNNYIISLG